MSVLRTACGLPASPTWKSTVRPLPTHVHGSVTLSQSLRPPLPKGGLGHLRRLPSICAQDALEKPPAAWLVVPARRPSESGPWGSHGGSEFTYPSPAQGLCPSAMHIVTWPQRSFVRITFFQGSFPLPTAAPIQARC